MNEQKINKYLPPQEPNVMDLYEIKILICDLMEELSDDISRHDLDEICLNSGIINYFSYFEALDSMKGELIEEEDGKFKLTEKGANTAKELKKFVEPAVRHKLILTGSKYFSEKKLENLKDEVTVEVNRNENGYLVEFSCIDKETPLIKLSLYAPSLESAVFLRQRMKENSLELYKKINEFLIGGKKSK